MSPSSTRSPLLTSPKHRLLLATKNAGKIKEIKEMLKGFSFEIFSLAEMPEPPRVREDGKTFEANATQKARIMAKRYGLLTLADDSGLEVDALGGAPGVKSARFAGPRGTHEQLCHKVLRLLEHVPARRRQARFVCVLALAEPRPDGQKIRVKTLRGICRGTIAHERSGSRGFAYDAIFIPTGFKHTFGLLSSRTKNRVSHRAQALKRCKHFLRNVFKK